MIGLWIDNYDWLIGREIRQFRQMKHEFCKDFIRIDNNDRR